MSNNDLQRTRSGSTPIPMVQPQGKQKVTLRKLVSGMFHKKEGPLSQSAGSGVSEDEQARRSSKSLGEIKPPLLATYPQMAVPSSRPHQPIVRQHSLLTDDAGVPRKPPSPFPDDVRESPSQRRRSRSFLGESGEISARLDTESALSPHEQALLFVPGQWKFGNKLGSGSFGSVWSGVFKPNNKCYAIKKVKSRPEGNDDIQREVELMASMGGHRNIVRYYGGQLVAPGAFFWIVMENMECGTFADVMALQNAPLTEPELGCVLRDVCSGLGYLHNLGVLHKDVKAANILLNAKGFAKLADFGVSQRVVDSDADECDTAVVPASKHAGGGTLAFLAPEVVKGQVCAKSDVWALGITAMQLLMRVSPFEHLPDLQMAEAIVSGPPPRLPDSFGPEARAVVEQCLQSDLAVRASLKDVTRLPLIAYAAPRERTLAPLVLRVLAVKAEREQEEETARRRALVGGKK